tara:strand:- start:81 stop:521 length:441 start_codon:yes stop_codon:yes gene_type:complete
VKIISHRGNLDGPNPITENSPSYIETALNEGFDVEVDVRVFNGKLYLGHDMPDHQVNENFFTDKMWIHCKNFQAVEYFKKTKLNWFWHEEDDLTMTSKGFIWCYPGKYISSGITVLCGKPTHIDKKIMGICTDYPIQWKEKEKNEF